jgi:hypothetical protein
LIKLAEEPLIREVQTSKKKSKKTKSKKQ